MLPYLPAEAEEVFVYLRLLLLDVNLFRPGCVVGKIPFSAFYMLAVGFAASVVLVFVLVAALKAWRSQDPAALQKALFLSVHLVFLIVCTRCPPRLPRRLLTSTTDPCSCCTVNPSPSLRAAESSGWLPAPPRPVSRGCTPGPSPWPSGYSLRASFFR